MAKKIDIPFQAYFRDKMLSGRKTCTTRTKRYGRPGDWFRVFGAVFILTEVFQVKLNLVAFTCYGEEGFDSSDEFKQCWNKLHPNISFEEKPNRPVYLHQFVKK